MSENRIEPDWKEEEGRIVVQRVGGFSSEDIHRALFRSKAPEPKSRQQLKAFETASARLGAAQPTSQPRSSSYRLNG
jgi:hypothetical protein